MAKNMMAEAAKKAIKKKLKSRTTLAGSFGARSPMSESDRDMEADGIVHKWTYGEMSSANAKKALKSLGFESDFRSGEFFDMQDGGRMVDFLGIR